MRELQNCVERAVALARYDQATIDDLPEKIRSYRSSHVVVASDDPSELPPLEEVERRYVRRVLDVAGGNRTRAAKILGLGRKTLYRRLLQYAAASEGDKNGSPDWSGGEAKPAAPIAAVDPAGGRCETTRGSS